MQTPGAKRTVPTGGTSGPTGGDRRRVARRRTAREAADHAEGTDSGNPAGPEDTGGDGAEAADAMERADGPGGDEVDASRPDTASRRADARRRTARRAEEVEAAADPDRAADGETSDGPHGTAGEVPDLPVRPGEEPWTAEEVLTIRTALREEADTLRAEITAGETALSGLMRDSVDTAGDDEADTGTRNMTREHEMAIVANAREMLRQTERALLRVDEGTHGRCEGCGGPVGKARMLAFPRATLCVECKQRAERHH
ncbi:TraR/DksA C4-type zinc finger protein [Streptomyces sp. ST2-7A]|uniref:TraR/DksA family transcriptional regulator n=1 Tax=Streptomyces sp. ST2-7A TaxID=2907214 RepID=UPI001F4817E8|nr:TraR/DksA C4-type zinc finger protein [Streptomyces sp. ST2-7A]MCE7082032.1 TraR/DksA C4-type zinc finger protein [Streptomyces sp. ST2-7A]